MNELSERRRALLRQRLQRAMERSAPSDSLPRRERYSPVPLSFAQQRLWFQEQLDPGQPTYNIPIAYRLHGALDARALERSLAALVQRHEALRTTFDVVDGAPVQIIAPEGNVTLTRAELAGGKLHDHLRRAARRPFDLRAGPLLRAHLWRHNEREHTLLLTMHHLVADGWSMGVLFRELSALYAAGVEDGTPADGNLPPLAIQYPDFAVWQRRWLQGEIVQKQLAYWSRALGQDKLPALMLPTDHPRPAVMEREGALHPFSLPPELTAALKELAQSENATLFMTLLAAFDVLLYRYTRQDDVLVGTPIANRNRSELEPLVGFFVNTLVMRADLSGDPGFRTLLRRVREMALAAYENQDVPFAQVVEALQPERDLSRNPLFQAMFVLQNAPAGALRLPGLSLTPLKVDTGVAQFDLTLELQEMGQRLVGSFEYNRDLFEQPTIDRMAGHLQTLLEGIAQDPDRPISHLPLLTQTERRVFQAWNATEFARETGDFAHTLFAAQAASAPDAPAVIGAGRTLSFGQLDRRANQLAHHLRRHGIGPEVPVAIYMARAPEMVVALLGVLKAGGAYVPIDPAYPPARVQFMLEDCHAPLVLSQARLASALPDLPARILCLDSADADAIAQEDIAAPESGLGAENLAYVIYTSGSTGRPKGAMIPHRGLSNYLQWCVEAYAVAQGGGAPVHSSLSFDLTITSLLAPLVAGRPVFLLPEDAAGEVLSAALRQHRDLSLVKLTPSHLEAINQLLPSEEAAGRARALIIGGEALLARHIDFWREHAPETRLINEYGPTETVVGCCVYEVPPDKAIAGAVPIGRPIANTRLYVLDEHMRRVPIGVTGELYIGGAGVARGYLRRPGLTAARFLPDPFGHEPGARLYKSGDLARYLPDGTLEYLGREDSQVKIRGYRIEMGEIEAVLAQHPAVQQSVVLAMGDGLGQKQKRLVAYVVPKGGSSLTVKDLRQDLQAHLPAYMVPSVFMMMEALPLTPNGKIDRRALPTPKVERNARHVAPRTPLEQDLARIWAEVLGLGRVGVHENFFELGGHSLQAIQLVAKLNDARGYSGDAAVPVKALFLHPTIAELAGSLASEAAAGKQPEPAQSEVKASLPPETPFLHIERRPLLALFATGALPPVDAAALGYLDRTDAALDARLRDWCRGLPAFTHVIETALGRVAILLLPHFDTELYADEGALVKSTLAALRMARHLGARAVSLTGLIPSATRYGRAIVEHPDYGTHLPAVSTGHASTTAAVALSIRRMLELGHRDLREETVGVLGLGSIGLSSLRLMLATQPHPRALLLCDLYDKRDLLARVRQEIVRDFAFEGAVRLMPAGFTLPADFYASTLVLGATNAPDVLDVSRLRPGTMIVDDSSPHCFDPQRAIQRLASRGDLLFTEGGVLRAPADAPIREIAHVPEGLEPFFARFLRRNAHDITGCILSSLLSARFGALGPTVGLVRTETGVRHYQTLVRLGFRAADLHCDDYALPEPAVAAFAGRFGEG